MTAALVPALQAAGIPVASIDHVLEAMARAATDEAAWGMWMRELLMSSIADFFALGRAISVMPEGLMDLGDDAVGKQVTRASVPQFRNPQLIRVPRLVQISPRLAWVSTGRYSLMVLFRMRYQHERPRMELMTVLGAISPAVECTDLSH